MADAIRGFGDAQGEVPVLAAVELRTKGADLFQQAAAHASDVAGEHGTHHGVRRPIRLEMRLREIAFLGEFVFVAVDKVGLLSLDAQRKFEQAIHGQFVIVIHKHDEIPVG
ncbi:MAG: hypothetical protein ACXWUD_10915, partial [Methylosarcina sp.]